MDDKPIPKYEIREKTPEEELETIPEKKLLKKIKKERIKLYKEKSEWEKVINQIEAYKDNIEDLERKRKDREFEVKNLLEQRDNLRNELKVAINEIIKIFQTNQ